MMWRAVTVWHILALVYWHPSHYVGCTEQHQDVQPLPSQDISLEEEPEEKTQHHMVDETMVSHIPSLSEYDLLTAGDQVGEGLATQGLVEEEELHIEALEMEQPVAEMEPEPERGVPESEPEPEPQLPQTSIPQDQESTSDPEPTPPLSDPVAAVPEDPPSTLTSQDLTLNSVSEDVISDVSAPELSDGDPATANCEAGENNPFDNASPPVVLENTSNAHSAGTKTHTDLSPSPQADQGTPGLGQAVNASHMLKEKGFTPHVAVEMDPSVGGKDPEDIPTFDEWKRKVMEVEKEKTQAAHASSNGNPYPVKKAQKNFNNYASVECGAKILGSNPEAKSTSAILMENMDLYMLNPCSNKIWFVIELCEPIQLKQLDIANFELFCSTPKDFLVSISDRYPTNKWLKLGTFHGRDERTVQSFPLDEHLYAKYIKMFTKYIKVELVSHFGSEHFCPLSLIRVFGTSMVEEYEEIADPSERPDDQDDDSDNHPGYVPGEDKSSKNLIGSAKDAILTMVNNIADALGGGPEMEGNFSPEGLNMTETSSQLDTTTTTTTTTMTTTTTTTPPSMPDPEEVEEVEEVESPSDPDVPAAESPSSEIPVVDIPASETPQLELPLEEDKIITLLQEEEEDAIVSTVTLLDKEEEDDEVKEEREKEEQRRRQQESSEYCGLFPLSSFSSSHSCSASLQEYLHQQCSALLSKQREHQASEREPAIPPHTHTPAWQLPVYPSACPTPQQHHTQIHQLQDREHTPGQGEREASPPEPPNPPKDQAEAEGERRSGYPLLEPSQTSTLPEPSSATESPAAKPTAALEPPQLSTEDLPKELRPESSQEVRSEEEQMGPTATIIISTPVTDKPRGSATVDQVWVPPTEERPDTDVHVPEQEAPIQATDITDPSHIPLPTVSPSSEQQPAPPAVSPSSEQQPTPSAEPETGDTTHEVSPPAPTTTTQPELSSGLTTTTTEIKVEDLVEDILFPSSNGNGQLPHPSSPVSTPSSPHSDFYAGLHNGTEQGNGNQVHGSSQKESVFMRLNNRIKALEMNMSLSGRYLEQLSQRYRKQMEEMQRAFNKTIIKLQNTSRLAEEQDQRQTESIQSLQGQLENITQLVLNLSVRVSQLQGEVSDRQSYLLLCLVLCLFLGLLLCANHCRISAMPSTTELELAIPRHYSYCCPEREFTSCDDTGLKRAASYPLLHSESYQFPTTEGPESLLIEERQRFSPANRQKKRSKIKHSEKVETLKPSHTAPELANGAIVCNGALRTTNPTLPAREVLHPVFRDSPSEGSSEGSSHSDDPSFCGIAAGCTRLCDGPPPPRTRAEKRALRRRRSKPGCMVVDVPHAARRDNSNVPPISSMQDLMTRNKELSSGTFGVFRYTIMMGSKALTYNYWTEHYDCDLKLPGETFKSLLFQYRIGTSTISQIVMETCAALYRVMKKDFLKTPSTEVE